MSTPKNTASVPELTDECSVCFEEYSGVIHKKIVCPSCNYDACMSCIKKFLVELGDDPHCMNCNVAWTRKFLFENINKTFINRDLKKAKVERLFEIEKSRFVEEMPLLEKFKQLKDDVKNLDTYIEEAVFYRKEYQRLQNEMNELRGKRQAIGMKIAQLREIKSGKRDYAFIQCYMNEDVNIIKTKKTDIKPTFKYPCPSPDDCHGFITENGVCPICGIETCKKCFEIIDTESASNHVCDENTLKSAKAIRKETKPCPKCAVPIFKIIGCDQMWCTNCNIGYSWNTGKIIKNNRIHNPHYFEALREGKLGQNSIRNPGDRVCGGLPDHHTIYRMVYLLNQINFEGFVNLPDYHLVDNTFIRFSTSKDFKTNNKPRLGDIILEFNRNFTHNEDVVLDRIRNNLQTEDDNQGLRINYILNIIDKKKFASELSRKNTKRYKEREMLNIIEIYTSVCADNMRAIVNIVQTAKQDESNKYSAEIIARKISSDVLECIRGIVDIREYCNKQFQDFRINNNLSSYIISDQFKLIR